VSESRSDGGHREAKENSDREAGQKMDIAVAKVTGTEAGEMRLQQHFK